MQGKSTGELDAVVTLVKADSPGKCHQLYDANTQVYSLCLIVVSRLLLASFPDSPTRDQKR